MKVKKNRELIIFLLLVPAFLCTAFYISSRKEGAFPQFSIESKSGTGCSIFYEALKDLKLPVDRTLNTLGTQSEDSIQIIVPGGSFDINSDETKFWVQKGGVLVSLSSANFHTIDYGLPPKVKGSLSIYKYGKGAIIGGDINNITNKELKDKTQGAYELVEEIASYDSKKIYFNENNLYSQTDKIGIWDYLPLWAKFMAYQLVLALAAYFYYAGRRFGKAIPFYEEVERGENEYLFSASSLYRQARAYDLILGNYYRRLLREADTKGEDLLEFWEKEKLPSINEVKRLNEFMNAKVKRKPKEYLQTVAIIERLTYILKQRREIYWKTLKKVK